MRFAKIGLALMSACLLGTCGASAAIFIVNNNNLDAPVVHESTASSLTEGVKDGSGENNGGGTTISSSDAGQQGYWQGFQTGPSGNISLLSLDLTVLASSPGVNALVTGADTATFYLYTFPGADISAGHQVGAAIATVTASQIESGTPVGYTANNSSDIYQYNLINSASGYDLLANTAYAIVMMTSSGSQDVGWAESNTEANGDMGEFDHINTGGNNGGAYGQMEIAVVPEPGNLIAGLLLLVPLGSSAWQSFRRRGVA